MADILALEPHMTSSDKTFYKALGQRVAQLRKEQGLTQVQLAERKALTLAEAATEPSSPGQPYCSRWP